MFYPGYRGYSICISLTNFIGYFGHEPELAYTNKITSAVRLCHLAKANEQKDRGVTAAHQVGTRHCGKHRDNLSASIKEIVG